ncbi:MULTISPECIES: P-type DNA transfer ATPase VirB11 [Vibrio harveyi group]|uniref:P-type DNA transfer ATPase VirB11 n=1 Tax=Vibrio harveyi group TaxID=717610 RepID=UPI0006B26964|nr:MULTISPECIES: P-type DNA transfer ATPase VirB11 [Vibrio harveyi group]KOY43832.1 type IV secretion system protein VirB11 [Vibrio parahaemolyticus]MCG6438446.1 P-type DNA transfer ATPase VirB11 [Vibrio parahaemolyticus]MCS0112605.1 P-type DNA transfer ATPase VirB11 [Vibrio parahaemolyticus]MCS0360709.1 P-type DNA transfer ATPase VirB11 [Vibrio diabolicus]
MNSEHNKATSLLEYLSVLQPFLDDPDNTEIVINKPGEVITESRKGWTYHDVPDLTFDKCVRLAKLTATYSGQSLDERKPILSATLPRGERIQIAIPPTTLSGHVSLTIRKPSHIEFDLMDYEKQGFFDECEDFSDELSSEEKTLLELKENRKFREFLELAVASRKNIIVSGSTGSGKTTFFRSLLKQVPDDERLISIENVDELGLYKTHSNTTSLFYSAGGQGVSPITQQDLLESSLRMKPDRIFVAELIRGDEAFYYLRNVNSGHPGSITTMHANSAKLAIEQLVLFLKESQSGSTMSREDIKQLLFMCVDIIVQIKNVRGKRVVTEIYYDPEFKRSQMA